MFAPPAGLAVGLVALVATAVLAVLALRAEVFPHGWFALRHGDVAEAAARARHGDLGPLDDAPYDGYDLPGSWARCR